jgi:MarR family transcriptional regulator, organic hydroperoxide resistance regulator
MPARTKPTLHLLLHSARLVEDRIRRGLENQGIHHGQGRILTALREHGPQLVSELARGLEIAQPTATILIKRLETVGLVARRRIDGLSGGVRVTLTDAGVTAADFTQTVWEAVEIDLQAVFTREQNRILHELLRTLRNALGGDDPRLSSGKPADAVHIARRATL